MNKYDEAIKALTMCQELMLFDPMTGETHELWQENKDNQDLYNACTVALSALRDAAERENPKPLTLEELRERDGALVYCTYRRATKPGKPWEAVTQPFLVDAHRFMRLVGTDTCLSFDHWKTTWLAYDHPPKEAQG